MSKKQMEVERDIDDVVVKQDHAILNDQFAQLCYEVLIESEKGRVLMAHIYQNFVNVMFTSMENPFDGNFDKDKFLFKSGWRDLAQRLLIAGQTYEAALRKIKTKGEA